MLMPMAGPDLTPISAQLPVPKNLYLDDFRNGIQLRWLASAPALQVVRVSSLYPVFFTDNTFDVCFFH